MTDDEFLTMVMRHSGVIKALAPLTNDQFLKLVMSNLDTIRKYVDATPIVHGPPERVLSKTPHIPGALINTMSGTVTIGENVFLGHDVMLIAGTHDYEITTGKERVYSYPKEGFDIVIDDGAWIASRAIVLGPAHIGKNAVIGAGSIVRGEVEAGCLYAGNPARKIRAIDL